MVYEVQDGHQRSPASWRGPKHSGIECLESADEKAERVMVEGVKEMDWSEKDLSALRKGNPTFVKLVMRVRTEARNKDTVEVYCLSAQNGDMDESVAPPLARMPLLGRFTSTFGTDSEPGLIQATRTSTIKCLVANRRQERNE
jgi:hypothetical protein